MGKTDVSCQWAKLHDNLKANHNGKGTDYTFTQVVNELSYMIIWKQITTLLSHLMVRLQVVNELSYMIIWKQITTEVSQSFPALLSMS